ncbi:MAG: GIY-YIG nuclease family protein [Eubacteriales bacterium]|jgi:group I intron endonuclease
MTGIYSILNTANGKRYIGQSVNLSRRKSYHFNALRLNRHKNAHLQAAFNRYGAFFFVWSVLQVVVGGNASLDSAERHWIALYASNDPRYGYNGQSGGLTRPRASYATRLRMQKAQSMRRNRLQPDVRDSLN